jgi:hypothetical protein
MHNNTGSGISRQSGFFRRLGPAVVTVARRAAWLPLGVFLTHVVAARIFNAYESFPLLDVPMHLVGGIAIAYFIRESLLIFCKARLLGPIDAVVELILVFSLVCTAAVFWEFAEFAADRIINTHSQRGLEDTLADMLMGIIGGALYLAASIGRRRVDSKKNRKVP